MNCEYEICIYNINNKCLFDSVDIDASGMCADCILPNIDPEVLQQAKDKVLKRFKKSDRD